MTPLEIIGKNIKKEREQKFIKQEVLAKQLGITKGRMSQIENGECAGLTLKRIAKIADYLKTDFFNITYNSVQDSHLSNITNCTSLNNTYCNFSTKLVKAVADELINRMAT